MPVNCPLNGLQRSHHDTDVLVQNESKFVQHFDIVGVVHRDHDGVAVQLRGNDNVFPSHGLSHHLNHGLRDLNTFQFNRFVAEIGGLNANQVSPGHIRQLHQGIFRGNTQIGGHPVGFFQLVRADRAVINKALQPVCHF